MRQPLSLNTYCGLCNRLRVIASFSTICNKPFNIIWDVDEECNGEFEEVFELNEEYPILKTADLTDDDLVIDNFVRSFKPFGPKHINKIFKPSKGVLERIKDMQLPKVYNAIHVRRNDNYGHRVMEFEEFEEFIAGSKHPVYLSCDEEGTKEHFTTKYPDKIITHNNFINNGLRKTDLIQAVADIWISVQAQEFMPNKGSSFSDFILTLRKK